MFDLYWTSIQSRTFGQFVSLLSGYVVAFILPFVTRLTEMRVAPAEPLRYIAAELAFELDVVSAMLLTVQDTGSHTHGRAFSTYQLISFVFFLFFTFFIAHLIVSAIFQAAEVGLFALETLVIRQFEKTKVLVLFIVKVTWVL